MKQIEIFKGKLNRKLDSRTELLTPMKVLEMADAHVQSEKRIFQTFELDKKDRDEIVSLFISTVQNYQRDLATGYGFEALHEECEEVLKEEIGELGEKIAELKGSDRSWIYYRSDEVRAMLRNMRDCFGEIRTGATWCSGRFLTFARKKDSHHERSQ